MGDGAVNRRSSDFFEKLTFEKESERRTGGGGSQRAIIQLKHIPFTANNRCQLRAGVSTGCHTANGRCNKAPL